MNCYKYLVNFLFIIGVFSISSCDKGQVEIETAKIEGIFQGILYSKTYVTATGITSYDTISNNFVLEIMINENELVLNSSDSRLNDVHLTEIDTEIDTISAHYGNERVFLNEYSEQQDRIYTLYLNKTNENDSVYLESYNPPMGGWNSRLIFVGLNN